MNLVQDARTAMAARSEDAKASYAAFVGMCGSKPIRVPGMDTVIRLAIRLHFGGWTVEEAAGREYLYRWKLALMSRTFGVPHAIGMAGIDDAALAWKGSAQ